MTLAGFTAWAVGPLLMSYISDSAANGLRALTRMAETSLASSGSDAISLKPLSGSGS